MPVRYVRSDMILHVECDASYLTALKARSCAAGYHFLSSASPDPTKLPSEHTPPPANGAINVLLCQILNKEVVLAPPKPNLPPSSTMAKKHALYAPALRNLDNPNLPLPFKPITALPLALPMTP